MRTEHPNGTARTHERALHIGQHLESDARKPFAGKSHIDRRDIPQSGKARTHLVTSSIEHASTQRLQHPRTAVSCGTSAQSNIERLCARLNRRAHELANATRACRKGRLVRAGGGVYPRSLRHLDDRAEPPLPIGRKQKRRRMRTLDGRRNHDPPDLAPERRVKRLQRSLATVGNGNGHARKIGTRGASTLGEPLLYLGARSRALKRVDSEKHAASVRCPSPTKCAHGPRH